MTFCPYTTETATSARTNPATKFRDSCRIVRLLLICDIPLRKAVAKPRRMQVAEISEGNGAGVMRAKPGADRMRALARLRSLRTQGKQKMRPLRLGDTTGLMPTR